MPSTWEVTRSIVRRDGWGRRGLLRGLTALLARESVFNAVYFGGYYNMKLHFVPPEVTYPCINTVVLTKNPLSSRPKW